MLRLSLHHRKKSCVAWHHMACVVHVEVREDSPVCISLCMYQAAPLLSARARPPVHPPTHPPLAPSQQPPRTAAQLPVEQGTSSYQSMPSHFPAVFPAELLANGPNGDGNATDVCLLNVRQANAELQRQVPPALHMQLQQSAAGKPRRLAWQGRLWLPPFSSVGHMTSGVSPVHSVQVRGGLMQPIKLNLWLIW